MAEEVDCRGDPHTGEEHAYHHIGEDLSATDDVLERIAVLSGKNDIREHGVKSATKRVLLINMDALRRL